MSNIASRRTFLKTASAGAAALSMTASNRARAAGANDRIRIGIVGCGQRGRGAHMTGVHAHDEKENVEIVAALRPQRPSSSLLKALLL